MARYPGAPREARNAIVLWILESSFSGGMPDPSLLLIGLPQGPILSAEVDTDGSISARLRDQTEPTRERSPRRFDLAGFAALRLLCLPKAHLLFSRTDTPPRAELHDITFGDHIKVRRIVADAKPGQAIETVGDHRDLRRSNLHSVGAPAGPDRNWSHKGRKLAIQTAVANLVKSTEELGLTPEEYEALLRVAFKLVDRLSLASAQGAAGGNS